MHTSVFFYTKIHENKYGFFGQGTYTSPVSMLWFGTSSQNIHKTIKGSNLSFEMSDDKGHIYLNDLLILGNRMSKMFMANVYGTL